MVSRLWASGLARFRYTLTSHLAFGVAVTYMLCGDHSVVAYKKYRGRCRESFSICIFFFKSTSDCMHWFLSLGKDQYTVAQWTEMTEWAFPDQLHVSLLPWWVPTLYLDSSQPILMSFWSGVYAHLTHWCKTLICAKFGNLNKICFTQCRHVCLFSKV